VNQGGTADYCLIRPWRRRGFFCRGLFLLPGKRTSDRKTKGGKHMAKTFGKITNIPVTGISFKNRQQKLFNVMKADSCYLTLRREPNNPYDPNAIQVLVHSTTNGKTSVFCIGYIPKNTALWMARKMDANKLCRISEYKIVGKNRTDQHFGCRLTITHEI
jgi:hypothetical protein